MTIRRADISTWNKTASLLYASEDLDVALEVYKLELKFYKRKYNLGRIEGRIKRLYVRALTFDKALIDKIKPIRMRDINYILGSEALLRAYLKFKENVPVDQLYRFLKYETLHKDRFNIKQTLAAQIVKEPNFGILDYKGE